jgi:hypothetical protein
MARFHAGHDDIHQNEIRLDRLCQSQLPSSPAAAGRFVSDLFQRADEISVRFHRDSSTIENQRHQNPLNATTFRPHPRAAGHAE